MQSTDHYRWLLHLDYEQSAFIEEYAQRILADPSTYAVQFLALSTSSKSCTPYVNLSLLLQISFLNGLWDWKKLQL